MKTDRSAAGQSRKPRFFGTFFVDEFCRIEIGDREVDLRIFPQLICILYVVLGCDGLPSTQLVQKKGVRSLQSVLS